MGVLGGRRGALRLGGALRGLAAAVLVALLANHAAALDLEARPLADGFRTGRWTPIRLVVSTDAEPFEGEVVLRVGPAQVHRVPLSLPAHERIEVVVGVLPFRPSERVEVEAGNRSVALDIRVAAGPLLAAEAAHLEAARRERGPGVVAVGEEDSALWEGFDEVLVSRETAMNRWLLTLDGDRAWVRPVDRPWGLVWETSGEPRKSKIPSIQGGWVQLWPGTPWGPSARGWFLGVGVGIVLALAAGLVATRGRSPRLRCLVVGVLVAVAVGVATIGPKPRPAVSALCVVGPTSPGRWQARGFGCASRGSQGDLFLEPPGVPRPVFEDLDAAQEGRWGIVWGERPRLVFPSQAAGQSCWFEWQARVEVTGRVVAMRDGGAANETDGVLSPATLLLDGRATVRETLAGGESLSPGPADPLPSPLTPSLLSSLDPEWRRKRLLIGSMSGAPPGLSGVDLVDGQTWLWAPLD